MKKTTFILLLLIITSLSRSQTLSPKVISTAGNEYNSSNVSWSWTMGETIIPTLQSGNNMLTQGFQQPEVELLAGFTSSHCAGETFSLPYTAYGIAGSNNVFTALLSDASGDFTNAVDIGTTTGNSSGTITVTIPTATPSGNGYRIKIRSSTPDYTGKQSSVAFSITEFSISTSSNTSTCRGTSVNLSASGGNIYSWLPSSGLNNPNISNPVATPLTSTTYTVTVENAEGCTAQAQVSITVTDLPVISSAIIDDNACGGQGSVFTFISGGIPPYTFAWSTGETTNAVTSVNAGDYTISVTGGNCTSVRTLTVGRETNTTDLNVKISNLTSCGLRLSWDAHPLADSYRIRYKEKSATAWSAPILAGTNLFYDLTGLNAAVAYNFRVIAFCPNGNLITQKTAGATTKICTAPVSHSVTVLSTTKARIQWTAVCASVNYRVRYRKTGSATWVVRNASSTSVTLRDLTAATDYEYQIRSNCSGGNSSYTPIGVFSTPAKREEERSVSSGMKLQLFPNPNSGQFWLMLENLNDKESTVIEVYNLLGQKVYAGSNYSTGGIMTYSVNIQKITDGVFELRVKNGEIVLGERFVVVK